MLSVTDLTDQVKTYLIQTGGQQPRHEVYNRFVNECIAISLTEEDFYKKVLAIAYKGINWEQVEEDKKAKAAQEKAAQEAAEKEKEKAEALAAIYQRLKSDMNTGVLEADELANLFRQARAASLNTGELADYIKGQIDKQGYQPYPAPTYQLLSDPVEELTSTNWYDEWHYRKINPPAAPPPPPPPPSTPQPAPKPPPPPKAKSSSSSGLGFVLLLLLIAGGLVAYFLWYQPYMQEKEASKRYTIAINVWLRSSPRATGQRNTLQQLPYGTQLMLDEQTDGWSRVEANGQEGYVSSRFLLSRREFNELNSIFADADSREAVLWEIRNGRALLEYFYTHSIMGNMPTDMQKELYGSVQQKPVWLLQAKKSGTPNTIYTGRVVYSKSRYKDFAFIITNLATQKRKFVLYSFSNTEEPQMVYEEDAPDAGDIISISKGVFDDRPYIVNYSNP
jgi:hypothetical protein